MRVSDVSTENESGRSVPKPGNHHNPEHPEDEVQDNIKIVS